MFQPDKSMLEGGNNSQDQLHSNICFGRITRVYPSERMCEIKTFMGRGAQDDLSIPKAQWINMDANPQGDVSGAIPRLNSYGLVFWIKGEPFIFGFFSPLNGTGTGKSLEDLNEGDRIISTIKGNKIILRAHGEIQIQSTPTCRSIYFPDSNLLNTLCQNYEFRCNGGAVDWHDNKQTTIYTRELRDGLKRKNIIFEERGAVGGPVISRTTIGAGGANGAGIAQPVWTEEIWNDGSYSRFIRQPGATVGHLFTVKPTGDTELSIAGKFKATIGADGATVIDIGPDKATLSLTAGGALELKLLGKASVTATAGVDVKSSGKVSIHTTGAFEVQASGTGKFKAKNIEIDGGGSLESVLTTPSALSDFTGSPIKKGSDSVKVSS